jgi:hypothetical protein
MRVIAPVPVYYSGFAANGIAMSVRGVGCRKRRDSREEFLRLDFRSDRRFNITEKTWSKLERSRRKERAAGINFLL